MISRRSAKLWNLGEPIRLNVPFYKQHYDFTCGPASLMMAMKYFDRKIPLTNDLETDIWRESNMVESYGTSRYGLAFSAAKRGFSATIIINLRGIEWVRKLSPPIEKINFQMLRFFFEERRKRCFELGVSERREQITESLLRKCLASESVPLLLTNTSYFSKENLPHWVAVNGVDRDRIYLNNPLGKKTEIAVSLRDFSTINGYKGDECVIEVRKIGRGS